MKVVEIDVRKLKHDPNQVRVHNERNIEAIKASLAEFGQQKPIVIGKGNIVLAGNGTLQAARELGWKTIQIVRTTLKDARAIAYAIADNRTAELAEWDSETLLAQLESLQSDVDLDSLVTGFSPDDLKALSVEVDRKKPIQEDEVPDPPKKAVTRKGDLWQLGRHRLLCGDATCKEDVEKLLDGAKPQMMVTDPPYGVDYDPAWRNEAAKKGQLARVARRVGKVANDDRIDWTDAWLLFPGGVVYMWHAGRHAATVQRGIEEAKFDVRCQIIWAKSNFPISRGHYHWRHEPCWYAVRKGAQSHWVGDRKQTTLWNINLDENVAGGHSTQKPVECMARPIRNHNCAEIYDPFVGSGTTIIACEQLKRTCYAMEIEPIYVDVCVERWQKFTGQKAKRIK